MKPILQVALDEVELARAVARVMDLYKREKK
jgi:3-keto-L-gulonate-6-phosphate decarboxylase